MNKKNIGLLCITIFLFFTYCFSFKKSSTKKNLSTINTQLINEKNKNLINKFVITKNNQSISLIKGKYFWVIQDSNNLENFLPIETQTINNFLTELTTLRKVSLISNKIQKNNNFGFDSEEAIKIEYFLEDSTKYVINFGNKDFSKTYRYFMPNNSLKVYQIDYSLEEFFNLSVQNWAEPYIFSKTILNYTNEKDIQKCTVIHNKEQTILSNTNTKDFYTKMNKILQLRHGCFPLEKYTFESEFALLIEFGNKKWAQIQISKNYDAQNDYTLLITYFDELNQKKYEFTSKISLWTYNKIKEITL